MENIEYCKEILERIRRFAEEGNISAIVKTVAQISEKCINFLIQKAKEKDHTIVGITEIGFGCSLIVQGETEEGIVMIISGLHRIINLV